MKKSTLAIISFVLLSVLISSCNQKDIKDRVLGEWTRSKLSYAGAQEIFDMHIDPGNNYLTVSFKGSSKQYIDIGKYEIKADSIIFYKDTMRWDYGKIVKCDKHNLVIERIGDEKQRWEKVEQ